MILFDFHILFKSFTGNNKLLQVIRRCRPCISNHSIRYPAFGTRSISILPRAPTNNNSTEGSSSLSASAIDSDRKQNPPVPHPLQITLSHSSKHATRLLIIHHSD